MLSLRRQQATLSKTVPSGIADLPASPCSLGQHAGPCGSPYSYPSASMSSTQTIIRSAYCCPQAGEGSMPITIDTACSHPQAGVNSMQVFNHLAHPRPQAGKGSRPTKIDTACSHPQAGVNSMQVHNHSAYPCPQASKGSHTDSRRNI